MIVLVGHGGGLAALQIFAKGFSKPVAMVKNTKYPKRSGLVKGKIDPSTSQVSFWVFYLTSHFVHGAIPEVWRIARESPHAVVAGD